MTRHILKRCYTTIFIALFLLGACSSTGTKQADPNAVLEQISKQDCARGFFRPPGVRKCLNLTDLVAGRINTLAPIGKCPENFTKKTLRGYCLPKYSIIACGKKTFACDRELNDTFKVNTGPFECPDGTIVVTVDGPLFDENGALFLGTRTAVSCAPPSKIDPV